MLRIAVFIPLWMSSTTSWNIPILTAWSAEHIVKMAGSACMLVERDADTAELPSLKNGPLKMQAGQSYMGQVCFTADAIGNLSAAWPAECLV